MLSHEQIEQAAQHLFQARQTKTKGDLIPGSCRPTDRESALAIQGRVMELLGEPLAGWKCGVPKGNGPLVMAPLPASAILRSSPCVVPGPQGKIEPEIAFVVARDLPPRPVPYSANQIQDAIQEARMVLELLGTRYQDHLAPTPIDLLADSYNHHALFIGPVITNIFDLSLESLHVKITSPGAVLFDKVHPHPSGDPMKSFSWLVHFLNERGQGLKEGQIVTTGSYAGIVEAPLGVPLHIELGGAGSFDCELITGGA